VGGLRCSSGAGSPEAWVVSPEGSVAVAGFGAGGVWVESGAAVFAVGAAVFAVGAAVSAGVGVTAFAG
jgi:hypothetical protein